MSRPDVLLIPVGGSAKAYTPAEAKTAIETLNPKLIIPTHYKTAAADSKTCDLQSVEEFLSLMKGTTIRRVGSNTITVSSNNLPSSSQVIQVFET
jgi:L-ascorbate metabolism protein UlaG (beta-lactamase superfamily)